MQWYFSYIIMKIYLVQYPQRLYYRILNCLLPKCKAIQSVPYQPSRGLETWPYLSLHLHWFSRQLQGQYLISAFWTPALASAAVGCRKPSTCSHRAHGAVLKRYQRASQCPHSPLKHRLNWKISQWCPFCSQTVLYARAKEKSRCY